MVITEQDTVKGKKRNILYFFLQIRKDFARRVTS